MYVYVRVRVCVRVCVRSLDTDTVCHWPQVVNTPILQELSVTGPTSGTDPVQYYMYYLGHVAGDWGQEGGGGGGGVNDSFHAYW